jgi:hypothetical protein
MARQATCDVRGCTQKASYLFGAVGSDSACTRCRLHALVYWPVCGRAIKVALLVGTILLAINQGDVILARHVTMLVVAKIGLTYVVPFSVSNYSALAANRLRHS